MRVLIVCTGNICRSPTAEALLRHHLKEAGLDARVLVDSAGTENWNAGCRPTPLAVEMAKARGYDMGGLIARQIEEGDFSRFDLMLALDRGHVRILERLRPPDSKSAIALFMTYGKVEPDEVPDPYFGGPDEYGYALDLIESAVPGVVARIRSHLEAGASSAFAEG